MFFSLVRQTTQHRQVHKLITPHSFSDAEEHVHFMSSRRLSPTEANVLQFVLTASRVIPLSESQNGAHPPTCSAEQLPALRLTCKRWYGLISMQWKPHECCGRCPEDMSTRAMNNRLGNINGN